MKNSYAISINSDEETITSCKGKHSKKFGYTSYAKKTLSTMKNVYKKVTSKLFESLKYVVGLLGVCLTGLSYLCYLRLLGVVGTEFIGLAFAAAELPTFIVCLFIGAHICWSISNFDISGQNIIKFLIYHFIMFSAFTMIIGSVALACPEIVKNTNTDGGICMVLFGSLSFFVFLIVLGS